MRFIDNFYRKFEAGKNGYNNLNAFQTIINESIKKGLKNDWMERRE
jgi:hypothetical protein